MRVGAGSRVAAGLPRSGTCLLTTFRRSGEPVSAPVSVAVHGGRAYFVTAIDSGKARRLARCDRVMLAPCTVGGTPLGGSVVGRARRLATGRRVFRHQALRPRSPVFWSWLLYRLRGHTMALYEVEIADRPDEA